LSTLPHSFFTDFPTQLPSAQAGLSSDIPTSEPSYLVTSAIPANSPSIIPSSVLPIDIPTHEYLTSFAPTELPIQQQSSSNLGETSDNPTEQASEYTDIQPQSCNPTENPYSNSYVTLTSTTTYSNITYLPSVGDTHSPTSDTPSSFPTACPISYTFYGGNCYKLITLAQSWFDSAVACQQQGGFLATISFQEKAFVFQFLDSVGYEDSVWIGLHKIVHNEYQWIDKSATSFWYWYSGQPNDINGNQLCIRMLPSMYSRRWDDFYCETKLAALCKFNETAKFTTNEGNCRAIVKLK